MSCLKAYYDALIFRLGLTDLASLDLLPWLICLHSGIEPQWLWSCLGSDPAVVDPSVPVPHYFSAQAVSSQQRLDQLFAAVSLPPLDKFAAKQQEKLLFRPMHLDLLTERIRMDFAWLVASQDHHMLSVDHPAYPGLLKQISDPPFVLYVQGQLSALCQEKPLAIVGSRDATRYGKEIAYKFAGELVSQGWVVNSGFALGVDGAAHQGALAKHGITLAVLGNGIDYDYPKAHNNLRYEITQHGALLSEFPLGTLPRPFHFPLRNRLISGMSRGVLVVEAGEKSGSLLTAKMALEQNREVFAVPGSIYNPVSQGCHGLIQQGAKLVCSVDDIVGEFLSLSGAKGEQATLSSSSSMTLPVISKSLRSVSSFKKGLEPLFSDQPLSSDDPSVDRSCSRSQYQGLSAREMLLLEHLGSEMLTIDDLVDLSGLKVQELTASLLAMELAGLVQLRGAYYQLCKLDEPVG